MSLLYTALPEGSARISNTVHHKAIVSPKLYATLISHEITKAPQILP